MIAENEVRLTGKVSRITPIQYTPSGMAIRSAVLAVTQKTLEKDSVGYVDLLFFGDVAERNTDRIRIGSVVSVRGSLWNRSYRDRKGTKVTETRVVVEAVERRE